MNERPPITTISTGDLDRQQALLRQREIRHQEPVPIYVMYPPDVPDVVAIAGLRGVYDTLDASGQNREIQNFGSRNWSTGDYSSAQWYVDEAYKRQDLKRDVGFGPQLDTAQFGRLFTIEPWQETRPHWEVLIVNKDLNSKAWTRNSQGEETFDFINYVFGVTNPEFPYSVQSVRRILETPGPNEALRLAMIRNLLRHEVGHMFGLVGRARAVESLGSHCPNPCSMKQTLNLRELAENTVDVERRGLHFCGDCTKELEASRDRFRPETTS